MAKQSNVGKTSVEPDVQANPQTADEFVESGWRHFSKKEYYRAEADFQKALEMDSDNVDTLYALGMAQQASGRPQDAIHTFEKVIQALESPDYPDHVRALMLTRLARGHISRMKTGDWKITG